MTKALKTLGAGCFLLPPSFSSAKVTEEQRVKLFNQAAVNKRNRTGGVTTLHRVASPNDVPAAVAAVIAEEAGNLGNPSFIEALWSGTNTWDMDGSITGAGLVALVRFSEGNFSALVYVDYEP